MRLQFQPREIQLSSLSGRFSAAPSIPTRVAAPCRHSVLRAVPSRRKQVAPEVEAEGDSGQSQSLVFALTWAGLVAFAALGSPNQTPLRDQVFLEELVGLVKDPEPLNRVFFCLFNIMGVWPAVFASLLLPSGKSANGVRTPPSRSPRRRRRRAPRAAVRSRFKNIKPRSG